MIDTGQLGGLKKVHQKEEEDDGYRIAVISLKESINLRLKWFYEVFVLVDDDALLLNSHNVIIQPRSWHGSECLFFIYRKGLFCFSPFIKLSSCTQFLVEQFG